MSKKSLKNMVGREIADIFPKRPKFNGDEVVFETVHFNAFDTNKNRYVVKQLQILKLKKVKL